MSDVSIDVQTEYWSWDTCPYSWDECDLAWDEALERDYGVDVDEPVKTVDSIGKFQAKFFKESSLVQSGFGSSAIYNRTVNENAKLSETKNIKYAARKYDGVNVFDALKKGSKHTCEDEFSLYETKHSFAVIRSFVELFGMSETYWDNIGFFVNASEVFTITDKESHNSVFDRTLTEYLILGENLAKGLKTLVNDSLKAADKLVRNAHYKRSHGDSFGISESGLRKIGQVFNESVLQNELFDQPELRKGFYEKVDFAEGFSWRIAINNTEEFGLTEDYSKIANFDRTVSEVAIVIEGLNKDLFVPKSTSIIVNDVPVKQTARTSSEQFSIRDFESNEFGLGVSEYVNVVDLHKLILEILKSDKWELGDGQSNHPIIGNAEQFAVSEGLNREVIQSLNDAVVVGERIGKLYESNINGGSFAFDDGFDRTAKFVVKPFEMLLASDTVTKNVSSLISDGLNVIDGFDRTAVFARILEERFSVAETYWDNILFYLGVLEEVKVHEGLLKHSRLKRLDVLDIQDSIHKAYQSLIEEADIGFSEHYGKNAKFKLKPTEAVRIIDQKLGSRIGQTLVEKLVANEVLSKNFKRETFIELVNVDSEADSYMHYHREPQEALSVSEQKLGSQIGKSEQEYIVVKELSSKILSTAVKELLSCEDEIGRQVIFVAVIKEALRAADQFNKNFKYTLRDKLSVSERITKRIDKMSAEGLLVMDGLLREFIARRLLGEQIDVNDYLEKAMGCLMSEEIETYDTLIKACEGIISNISITEGELTLERFLEIVDSPLGYTKFVDFKVGEYEYQNALVRLTMKTAVNQVQPVAPNVVMHVDIPDTDDRGEVVITDTSAPTKVYFNKFYYNPPEVNVTLKAGNTADGVLIPNIVTTEGEDDNGRYFEVELWDENWANRKSGKIGWVSKGY